MHKAVKHDQGKLPWDLLSFDAIEQIVRVLQHGEKKYSAWNWTRGGGLSWSRVFAAAMRHMAAWARGETLDKESGLPHLAHAACCIMFLLHYAHTKKSFAYEKKDDRFY